ncbi:MAG: hypothetical protein ACNA78_09920 [Balneolaceae bacterium]
MARLKSDSDAMELAATATAASLQLCVQWTQNRAAYRTTDDTVVHRDEVVRLCNELEAITYRLQYLADEQGKPSSRYFSMLLAGALANRLGQLHRRILFFPADTITDMISVIDRHRPWWRSVHEIDFLNDSGFEQRLTAFETDLFSLKVNARLLPETSDH